MTAAFRAIKGHACLIEAVQLLRRNGITCQVTFAGDTSSATGITIRRLVQSRRLTDVVVFAGQVSHMADALRTSDIFVLPSITEGLPLSILEAMACGLPVVATNVGGIPEWSPMAKTGYLVPPQNPVVLAGRLAELIASMDLRRKMGRLAAEKAQLHFSFVKCAHRSNQAYRRAISIRY